MQTIQVSVKALKAASRVSAKYDIRYYLNSVYVEAAGNETVCVATDGHHLVAIRRQASNEVPEATSVIVPNEIVAMLTKGRKKKDAHMIDLVFQDGKWVAPLPTCGHIQFEGIEAKYPHWRGVTPKETSGVAGNYNTRLLKNLQDAASDLGASGHYSVSMSQNGEGAALVTCNSLNDFDMVGIIMPYRDDSKGAKTAPVWAIAVAQEEEAKETEAVA
ncbi:MAG: hypothetical protein WBF88_17700 [Pusillimonas sp.]